MRGGLSGREELLHEVSEHLAPVLALVVPTERSVDEGDLGVVHREGVDPARLVVGGTEMVDGGAHGSSVMVHVGDHCHELGAAAGRLECDYEPVGDLLVALEGFTSQGASTHRHHHVGEYDLEFEGDDRLLFGIVGRLPVGAPPLLVGGFRLFGESFLNEESLDVLDVDLPTHAVHRFVERGDDGDFVAFQGCLGGVAVDLFVVDHEDFHSGSFLLFVS